jgi:hypothetical protein
MTPREPLALTVGRKWRHFSNSITQCVQAHKITPTTTGSSSLSQTSGESSVKITCVLRQKKRGQHVLIEMTIMQKREAPLASTFAKERASIKNTPVNSLSTGV